MIDRHSSGRIIRAVIILHSNPFHTCAVKFSRGRNRDSERVGTHILITDFLPVFSLNPKASVRNISRVCGLRNNNVITIIVHVRRNESKMFGAAERSGPAPQTMRILLYYNILYAYIPTQ